MDEDVDELSEDMLEAYAEVKNKKALNKINTSLNEQPNLTSQKEINLQHHSDLKPRDRLNSEKTPLKG